MTFSGPRLEHGYAPASAAGDRSIAGAGGPTLRIRSHGARDGVTTETLVSVLDAEIPVPAASFGAEVEVHVRVGERIAR